MDKLCRIRRNKNGRNSGYNVECLGRVLLTVDERAKAKEIESAFNTPIVL